MEEIIIPKKAVDVKYIKLLNTKVIEDIELKKYILSNLEKISGDFRQEEIKEMWKKFKKKNIYISEFEGHVSSGYYIRQFVEDFGKQLGYLGIALDITRTEIII